MAKVIQMRQKDCFNRFTYLGLTSSIRPEARRRASAAADYGAEPGISGIAVRTGEGAEKIS